MSRLYLAASLLWLIRLATMFSFRSHQEKLSSGRTLLCWHEVRWTSLDNTENTELYFSYRGWVPNNALKCLASKDKFIYQESNIGLGWNWRDRVSLCKNVYLKYINILRKYHSLTLYKLQVCSLLSNDPNLECGLFFGISLGISSRAGCPQTPRPLRSCYLHLSSP